MKLNSSSALETKTSPKVAHEILLGGPVAPAAPAASAVRTSSAPNLWQTAAAVLAVRDQTSPITRFPSSGALPLSFAQERLWWLEQLQPGAAYYNVPMAWQIEGELNLAALEQSLNYLVQRHEPLRTSFPSTSTGPAQHIGDWQFRLTAAELKEADGLSRWQSAVAQAGEFVRQPFELSAGPLCRAVLYRIEPRRHLLVLVLHQMVFDGASMRILDRELGECYRAFASGSVPALPPLPVRYSDFALWQRQNLRGDLLRADLDYWRGQCLQPYAPLPLPFDHPRCEGASTPGTQAEVVLPKALAQRLKRQGRLEGLTPFAALLASFQAFLARETGQQDLIALVTAAGRNQLELRHMVGLVANVLPMRFDFSGDPSFGQVLQRAGAVVASSLAHQMLPLDHILKLLPASAGGSNAFASQVAVLYYHQPLAGFGLPGVTFTPFLELDNGTAKSDLTLDISDSPAGITGHLKYRADLFERPTIDALIHGWKQFLEEALGHPDQPVFATRVASASPAPPPPTPHPSLSYVPPRNPVEEKLVEIWESVFTARPIGIHDRFFELGGHSLLAVRLNFRIRETFAVELPMQSLLEAQTIVALAEGLASGRWKPTASQQAPLRPVPRQGPLPLSFAQQRLWFLDQLEPNSPLYNVPVMARLRGTLDLGALRQTLNAIVARHEALRTRFVDANDGPVQVIEDPLSLEVRQHELNGIPESEREAEAQRLASEEANRPFNLSTGPLLRAMLLRLKADEHLLVLNLHHSVSDEWSLRVLFRELAALYSGFLRGQPADLPPLPVQYADYAVWQRQWLQGEAFEKELDFWKAQLGGNPLVTELPPDAARGSRPSFRGAWQTRALSPELSLALAQLAQREGVTLFMVLLAAFKTLLHRYTQQEDIIVGSPIAGRSQAETENLIGFFVNTLLLRTDLSGNPSFTELLQRIRSVTLGAYEHQEAPFNKIVEALHPERSLNHLPFTSLLFVLQNNVVESLPLPALQLEFAELVNDTAKFELTLLVQETSRGLVTRVEYNTDLFESATITRLLRQYETLLAGIAANPGQRLSALPLMPEEEQKQVLHDWNQTAKEYPKHKTLVDLFEEQVACTPQAEALVCGRTRLTYRELHARSSDVAQHLRALGVGEEMPVGICLERSWEMVAAILGTLQAGGAYVPLDPAYPQERLAFMVEDSGLQVVVTQTKLAERLSAAPCSRRRKETLTSSQPVDTQEQSLVSTPSTALAEPTLLLLDNLEPRTDAAPTPHSALGTPHPQSLAYIIYTSGSTGRPKGVALEHRGAVSLMHWARDVFSSEELSGVLAATSICFDLSVFELFVPLSWGGKVILAENALALAELPAKGEVTLLNTVPSAMRELLRLKAVPPSVRVVNLAGEPLSSELADQVYRETSVEKVYDLYGPTETTTYSTGALRRPGDRATIGRPLANEQVYVLDRQQQPVPLGAAGELYIGGDGLARGYLKRPDLTAQRFVAHPLKAGARLYRTGDLARWRPDGNLEYLGRLDQQVKLRGYRIELGEIETVLKGHAAVGDAVVLVREDSPGEKRLVAYVVARSGQELAEGELRQFLEHRLPSYMAPACFVVLQGFPLTPNGKVDRRALPRPVDAPSLTASPGYVAPRNPNEAALAELWCQLLDHKQVGIHDNFFHLGGHSLLATQVISRIAGQFQVQIPLRTIFEGPTVAELAEAVTQAQRQQASVTPAITRRVHGSEAEAVLARLAHLSDAEVEELLHDPTLPPSLAGATGHPPPPAPR